MKTKMVINLDPEYDKKLEILKANKEFSTKSETAVRVIEEFFDKNIELDLKKSKQNKIVDYE
ncbi:MAG: hypothetical protein LAN71_16995 [Acidobacteriia bacterium]|nr:hypothetical protein [Terriglobia bacterium]